MASCGVAVSPTNACGCICSIASLGYLLVSADEQEMSGLGLADQRHAVEAAASSRGWSDLQFIANEGYCARSLDRPGISSALAALAALAAGTALVLVVSELDRLSRSPLDFATLTERARREGLGTGGP